MSTLDPLLESLGGAGVAPEIASVVLTLVGVIVRLVRSDGSAAARLDALQDSAEVVKRALDAEKFPNPPGGDGGG